MYIFVHVTHCLKGYNTRKNIPTRLKIMIGKYTHATEHFVMVINVNVWTLYYCRHQF